MPYIGKSPANVPVTAEDIPSNSITAAKIVDNAITISDIGPNAVGNSEMADDAVGVSELSASGSPGSTTFLRGDNAWATPGVTTVNNVTGAVTAAHIRDAVESATNSHTFNDGDHTKLNAIENSATADQTKSDIEGLGIALPAANLTGNVASARLTSVPAGNLTGTVAAARLSTAATQSSGDNTTKIATTAYVTAKVTALIDGAPGTLNTLNELALAINDDASYNSTLTTALATKLPKSGGTMTGNVSFGNNNEIRMGGDNDLKIYHDHANSQNVLLSSSIPTVFASNDLNFANGANNAFLMSIKNDGKVGIGTSAPTFENGSGLEIRYAGGNGAHLKLTDNASGAGGTNGFDLYSFNTAAYIENYEAGAMVFRNNGAERMRILADGKVGIGTASLGGGRKLTVAGGAIAVSGQNTSHSASNMVLGQDSNAISQIRFYGANTSTAGILQFIGSSSNGTVGGERMRIDSTGAVTMPAQPHFAGYVNGSNGYWSNAISSAGVTISNEKIYAPVTGLYLVCLNLISANNSSPNDLNIFKNGTQIGSTRGGNGAGYKQRSWALHVSMSAGDYLSIVDTGPYTNSGTDTWMTGSFALVL